MKQPVKVISSAELSCTECADPEGHGWDVTDYPDREGCDKESCCFFLSLAGESVVLLHVCNKRMDEPVRMY
jgi:hypothetical protein